MNNLGEVDSVKKQEKIELKNKEYENLMSNILFYMINSLYNYDEICEKVYTTLKTFKEMIDDEEYIKTHFGVQMLDKLRESRKIRRKISSVDKSFAKLSRKMVKNPNHRSIIKPDIIMVSDYEYELIKKVSIFFENSGNTEKAAMNSEFAIKDIYTSIYDEKLKNLLSENSYKQLEVLREIDSILTQNRMLERNELIKRVVLAVHAENGNLTAIEKETSYSKNIIERVLEHSYVPILCRSLNIEVSVNMLHYEAEKIRFNYNYPAYNRNSLSEMVAVDEEEKDLILRIADYIIENKASYSKAAEKFGVSKKTICVKMKDKLPYISTEKSEQVNEVVKGNTASNINDSIELQERTLLEYELLMRGYTIEQIAYLVNNSYSSAQRDLSDRLSQISEEKGQLVKTKLQSNQSKNYFKN